MQPIVAIVAIVADTAEFDGHGWHYGAGCGEVLSNGRCSKNQLLQSIFLKQDKTLMHFAMSGIENCPKYRAYFDLFFSLYCKTN